MLREKILSIKFERDNITFNINKISEIKGHAEISIRKGKQIVVYEYQLEADFDAVTENDECSGNFKLTEINETDFDFHIPHIGLTKHGEKIGPKAKDLMKKCLKDEVIKAIRNLKEEIS
jgi:activator of HSP90 ATPase